MRVFQCSLAIVLLSCALVRALPKPKPSESPEAAQPEEEAVEDPKGSARAKKQTTTVCLEIKGNQATHTDCGPQSPQQSQQIIQEAQSPSATYLVFPQEPQPSVSYVQVPVVHHHTPSIPQIIQGHPGSSSGTSGLPDISIHPGSSGHPGSPGHPGIALHPGSPGHPGIVLHPGSPGHPGSAGHPGIVLHPGSPGHPGSSGHPGIVLHPGSPGHPGSSGHPGISVQWGSSGSPGSPQGSDPCDDDGSDSSRGQGPSSAIIIPPAHGPAIQVVPQGPSLQISGSGSPCPPCPCAHPHASIALYRNLIGEENPEMLSGVIGPMGPVSPITWSDGPLMMPSGAEHRSAALMLESGAEFRADVSGVPPVGPGPVSLEPGMLHQGPGMSMKSAEMDARNHYHYNHPSRYGYPQPYVIQCGPGGISTSTIPYFRSGATDMVNSGGNVHSGATMNSPTDSARTYDHGIPSIAVVGAQSTSGLAPNSGNPYHEHRLRAHNTRSTDAAEASEVAAESSDSEGASGLSDSSDKQLSPAARMSLMRAIAPTVRVSPETVGPKSNLDQQKTEDRRDDLFRRDTEASEAVETS